MPEKIVCVCVRLYTFFVQTNVDYSILVGQKELKFGTWSRFGVCSDQAKFQPNRPSSLRDIANCRFSFFWNISITIGSISPIFFSEIRAWNIYIFTEKLHFFIFSHGTIIFFWLFSINQFLHDNSKTIQLRKLAFRTVIVMIVPKMPILCRPNWPNSFWDISVWRKLCFIEYLPNY